jgi:DNA polymerase-3 subunit delta'
LFSGDQGVGKDAMAIEFAKALNCERGGEEACDACTSCKKANALQHPDIQLIVALPVGKNEAQRDDPIAGLSDDHVAALQEQLRLKAEDPYHEITIPKARVIKINSVREIKRRSAMSLFGQGRKVFILSHAEMLTLEASNSLLKTLEEPTGETVLILTTSERDRLLPTIISRCQHVAFDALDETEIAEALQSRKGAEPARALLAARLSGGSYSRAVEMLSADIDVERESAAQFLRYALGSRPVSLMAEIERLAAGKDRVVVERWLRVLHMWLHEALLVREQAHHADDESVPDDIKRFVERFPNANLIAALESIDDCIALLDKNIYLPLALTALAVDLNKHCTLETASS